MMARGNLLLLLAGNIKLQQTPQDPTVTSETGFRFFSFTPFQRTDFYAFNRLHGALSHALKYQAGRLMQQRGIIMTVSQKLSWQEKADSTDDRLPESVKA